MRWIFSLIIVLGIAMVVTSFRQPKQKIATQEALGEKLFHDKILSEDFTISCASCHIPAFAFADTVALSKGVHGRTGTRNTPSAMNMASRAVFFFDGRAKTLEHQVVFPIENPVEMNLPFPDAVQRVRNNKTYQQLFMKIFGKMPDSASIVQSIAAFERTLETADTPNDRWLQDKPNGMNAQQIRGRELFMSSRLKCFDCHFSPDLTGDEFRNIGLFNGKDWNDTGRSVITKNPSDIGKFKVPGLRNIAVTAPYMHNGKFKTLREVIDFYDNPEKFVQGAINRDPILPQQLNLTEQEKQDLESFLHSLTDDRFTK
ncbi:MAG: c-type cytochrome [Chitinophagales bacterium]|nr:c-type cytochrome [Chitinophagales bacterium]